MGYGLLWLEALAAELLVLATLVACIARIKWSWLRTGLLLSLVFVAEAAYAGFLVLIESLEARRLAPDGWGNAAWCWTIIVALGAIVIPLLGARRGNRDPGVPAAATWPLGKLAVTFLVVFALNLMTFWNLDVAVRQRLDALRFEAGALALSVAPPRVPDRDNAALLYDQAFELMGTEESWSKRWDERWDEWLYVDGAAFDPEDVKVPQFLDSQAGALRVLRPAAEKPACCFEHDYSRPNVDMQLPGLSRIRRASWLLALDAHSKVAAGDLPTAIEDTNALFMMAEHAASDPLVVGVVAAVAMDLKAVKALEKVLASGQASADELALVKIPETVFYRRFFDRALRMEEACALSVFCQLGAELRLYEMASGSETPRPIRILAPLYRVFLLDDDLASCRETMNEWNRLGSQPYYQAVEGWGGFEEKFTAEARGWVTLMFVPTLDRAAECAARGDARHQLARLGLAVSRYRAASDHLPERLDDLAPEFIPAVPADPFDGKPLKWKWTDDALVLYSVGPDLEDDGGMPIDRDSLTGDLTFTLPKSVPQQAPPAVPEE